MSVSAGVLSATPGRLTPCRLRIVPGAYYIHTGIWPLVSLDSFEMVTGEKVDDWLVQTVGGLVIVIGTTLLVGARRLEPAMETLLLAAGTAIAFTIVDVTFALGGVIPAIYLADAVVELLFAAGVLWLWITSRRTT